MDVLRLESQQERIEKPVGGSIYFIGNATMLLRYRGFTILTDPTFVHKHEKVSLGYDLTTTRRTDPAIEIGENWMTAASLTSSVSRPGTRSPW